MTRTDAKDSQPIVGSGDFLRDRGYLDPDEMRLKFALANEIAMIVEARRLKQVDHTAAGRQWMLLKFVAIPVPQE
jgi:hypothetical protein